MKRSWVGVMVVLGCVLLGTAALPAQVYSGSVTGVVTDPSGGVIPNARATLTDLRKGFSYSALSDRGGRYEIRNLPPGRYRLAVAASGMETYQQAGVTLTVGQNAQLNVRLALQGARQSVEVSATAPLLETQDASTGQVVDQRLINDLPLTSRSVFNLASLTPGVTQPPGRTFSLDQSAVNFVSNGGRNSTADILIDGVSQTNNENNSGVTTALYTPAVDAVQEFKVDQNTYNAAIGFGGNTVINVVTKSGGNQFHGSGFEFYKNASLNANSFFNNANGAKKTPNNQNQFGGTFGGPIQKDKLFFFFDYQGTVGKDSHEETGGVPSAAERQGDFGELCAANGGTFNSQGKCSAAGGQLWDPYTGTFSSSLDGPVRSAFVPFNNLATYTSPGNSKLAGTPYAVTATAGNLIDPVARKMMQLYPMPNVGVGTAQYDPLNNWLGVGGGHSTEHQFDAKLDRRVSEASLLSLRISRDWEHGEDTNCYGNVADPCTSGPNTDSAWSGSLDFDHTFSPTLVLTVTYGYARNDSNDGGVAADFPNFSPVATLGLPSYILASGQIATPHLNVGNGYSSVGSREFAILHYPLDTHTLDVGLSKMAGNHYLTFGYQGRFHRISFYQAGRPAGELNFSLNGTSQSPKRGTGGDALASLLIGFPQGGSGYNVDLAETSQNFAHALYLQDDWHASNRLTVNLGLRYELTLPRTERYNRMSWLDPDVVSPIQAPGLPQLHGGVEFASDRNPHAYNTDYNNWGPRIGIAYQAAKGLVVRSGYGIFFDPTKAAAAGTGGGGFLGFNQQTPLLTTFQDDGATPYGRLSNPFPAGIEVPPGNSQGLLTGIGEGVSDPIRSLNMSPYMQTWNFGVQKALASGILAEANYVGTKGTHLYFGNATNLNHLGSFVETATPAQITQLNSKVPNPFFGIITDPQSRLSNPTVTDSQLLLPFPQFTGFSSNDPPVANSIYHALQLRAEKRFSRGLQFLVTYVWSKSIDDSSVTCNCVRFLGGSTSLQDPNNYALERSVSGFDIPSVLQFSYVYQLPFGKGKTWGGNWNGWVDAVLGGWQTNGIWRFDDGLPVALGVNNSRSLPTYGSQRPNLTAALTRNTGSDGMTQYFADPTAAISPPPFTLGNAPRELSSVRIPGTATAALSLFKQFRLAALSEGSLLEFRVEAFNALNHPQFSGPNTTVGSSSFGKVTSQANRPREVQLGLKMYF